VAVGFSTTVQPWPRRDGIDIDYDGGLRQQQQVDEVPASVGMDQSLVRWPVGGAGRCPSPASSSSFGRSSPSDVAASANRPQCEPHQFHEESSPWFHEVDMGPHWPKGSPVL
jgi:hypothetical protein